MAHTHRKSLNHQRYLSPRSRFSEQCDHWLGRNIYRTIITVNGPRTDYSHVLFFFFFLLFFLLGRPFQKSLMLPHFKSDRDEIWQDCIDWYTRIFDLTSHCQDGGHDVISRRKMLPNGECISIASVRRVCISVRQLPISISVYPDP